MTAPVSARTRRTAGRAQQDQRLDPYRNIGKLPGDSICRDCGAVFAGGRWRWGPRPAQAHTTLCPACRRIAEQAPAGSVLVRGAFARRHKAEILELLRHQEEAEKQEHPLNRILDIVEEADGLSVTTTDIHLPRRIGTALKRAFGGELDMHFDDDACFARVVWSRPE